MYQKKMIWKVFSHDHERRLLFFIKNKITEDVSNRSIKRIIDQGLCIVNGKIERFSSFLLKPNDIVELKEIWQEKIHDRVPKINFKTLYEDDYFLIVDKPPFFVCDDKNLNKFFSKQIVLVHRLDKETSGILILAKSIEIKEKMKELFLKKEVEKYYLAIVDGILQKNRGKIEKYLVRKKCPFGQIAFKSAERGAYSLTFFKCLDKKENYSLVLCKILTGKTHQIRVHLAEMDHPILGDYHYCKKFKNYLNHVSRILLHAVKLVFIHPITQEKVEIVSALPSDFASFFKIDVNTIEFNL